MQPSEALGIAAQLAVALAGFAGIVVVFRPGSIHEWSQLDKFRLRLLLTNSALPISHSLLAILLLAVEPPIHSVWMWCSGVAFAGQLSFAIYARDSSRRLSAADQQHINKPLFYGISLLGSAAMILQVFNFAIWNRFWPFFAMIFMHLIAALVQFLRMVLLPPHTDAR